MHILAKTEDQTLLKGECGISWFWLRFGVFGLGGTTGSSCVGVVPSSPLFRKSYIVWKDGRFLGLKRQQKLRIGSGVTCLRSQLPDTEFDCNYLLRRFCTSESTLCFELFFTLAKTFCVFLLHETSSCLLPYFLLVLLFYWTLSHLPLVLNLCIYPHCN